MNNFVKAFVINLIIFALIALGLFLLEVDTIRYITLFKIWLWISACILAYYVILQMNKRKKEQKEKINPEK